MKKSKDSAVQKFLDEKKTSNELHYKILQGLRKIVHGIFPKVKERMIYGGIMFTIEDEDFSGIFSSKKHVSFEFNKGYALSDPNEMLEGTGKLRRHLKIKEISDIGNMNVTFFVEQVANLL